MVKITEKQILDWLDFDGFKYQLIDYGDGVRKIQAEPCSGALNEIRLTQLVDYLNQELTKQLECEVSELVCIKERLLTLEKTIGKKENSLGIAVAEEIGTHDVFGESIPIVGEFNAMGFLHVDPVSGSVKNAIVKFFEPDKSSRAIRKGEKIVFEVK